ncbi:MAG: GAF domain-containing protein [Anaerolineales bacterium]|nr:GAF domain-containing protein [Anaerolineales bacterium]
MDTEAKSRVHRALLSRRHAIADDWHKAIAQTGSVSLKAAEVRQHLVELTAEAIALLLTEPFDHDRAEAIGASLASFHYLESEALGRTQELLARQLVEGLPAEQVVELQPRLAALLGGLATGFSQQARETVLAEQEWIRGALTHEIQRAGEALRKAYDEVEQQVQERTAELRAANESLRHEIAERKRAEEEIKQRNRELSALNAIAATVSRSLDLEGVLSDALDKVLETMELEVGAIRLLDEQGGTLDLKVHRGGDLSPWMLESISRVKPAGGPLAEAIATGEPLIVEDVSANPIVELIGRKDLKSVAAIPLKSKGRVLGTMEVLRLDSRQFTSEEIQLLISISHQIGVAIENARLYKEARNNATQSISLFEIGQSLTSSLDLDRTLRLIVEQAAKLLAGDICTLFLYDRDADELLGQVRYGASDGGLRGVRVPLSHSQTAVEAKATLKPVVVEDTSQDHRVSADIAREWGIKSSLTVPLVAESQFLGVIFLDWTKAPRRFTANEIKLAQGFASQAAIALENAQLYAHSEELAISKERNRVAREIHDDLTQRLASLLMRIDLCLELIDEEPEEAKRELDKMGTALQDSIQEARRSIFALRPLALEQLGFRRALRTCVDDFVHQNEISVHLSLPEEGVRLPARMEYALFRIVQEALANVRWHAQADTVWIDLGLRPPDRIWLEIRDNGCGFDMAKRVSDIPGDDGKGLGLLHMRERVEAMRGSFRMETEPTVGTKITVTLPLES